MLEYIRDLVLAKRVLILGFGREGRSTYNYLVEAGGFDSIGIADRREITEDFDIPVTLHCGENYQQVINTYDVVFKSPGIVLESEALCCTCMLMSQVEVLLKCYKEQIIGITGTKGKSTTTSLIYHILKECGKDVLIAGNIGIPVFDIVDNINPDTILVCEFSSHQLEYVSESPHTGVLLNIHEEHLDHYGTMERYVAAKKRVYLYQEDDDKLFVNNLFLPDEGENHGNIISVGTDGDADIFVGEDYILYNDNRFDIPVDNIKLLGHHNYFNIGVAYGICRQYGISDEDFRKALVTFETLPHRLQNIGEVNGVTYYDDSISTICDTAIQALTSVKNAGTIIIGGMDRGIDYTELIEYLSGSSVEHIICMYATGKRIYDEIHDNYKDFVNIERLVLTDTLENAVELAKKLTGPGKACILSPAAASYGYFKNFEERGEVFCELVKR